MYSLEFRGLEKKQNLVVYGSIYPPQKIKQKITK
jgi:hypothetical protein